ncbi:MAG: hypothetical protein HY690_04440 [Chloroflexi bacterium]|nr:hypothetical protein [Chloroflexota bacterium]
MGHWRAVGQDIGQVAADYDLQRNQGYMRVGTSADTPQFAEWAQLNLEPHAVCPQWNYTLRPRPLPARDPPTHLPGQEVIP